MEEKFTVPRRACGAQAFSAQDTLKLTGRFCLENFSKDFFYFIKTDSKIKINHLWELKKLKKTILNDMQWILYQKRILKKKVVKFAQNCRNF